MKANRFQRVRAAGGTPIGHMIMEFGVRGLAKMLEVADVDFALIDLEHAPFSMGDMANVVAWLKATDIAPFVRVPEPTYHFIARTLDAGALGIMVPNVKSGAQAQAIVNAAKYAPLGQRGVGLGGSNSDYRGGNAVELMAYANQNTTLICQIESVEGIANLDEIASTPGIDVIWVGHFDLTQSMGIPGQFDHPRFLEALQIVVAAGNRHQVGIGIQPRDLVQAQEWMEVGFNVISYTTDIGVYTAALQEGVNGLRTLSSADSA